MAELLSYPEGIVRERKLSRKDSGARAIEVDPVPGGGIGVS